MNRFSNTFVEGYNYIQKLGGHPILWRRVKSPFLLTTSKAFVRSKKAMYNDRFCSRHFSCNCLSEKIMSVVDLPALKLHWTMGYTRSASVCNLSRATRANTFPTMLRRDIPR